MPRYLLLRNNIKTGPFSWEELLAQPLQASDLIWIESESATWQHPHELAALCAFVNTNDNMTEGNLEKHPATIIEPNFYAAHQLKANKTEFNPAPLSDWYSKTFSKLHAVLWLGSVVAGLLCAATLLQKINEATTKNSTGLNTIAAPVTGTDMGNEQDEYMYQNALMTEVVPVDTATLKPIEKAKPKVDLEKLVRLEANDYQVRLLGGIKNLRMVIVNKSAFVLDKIYFQLQYLNASDALLENENLVLKSIPPRSSKSLAVSASMRGVKIAYHITGIQSAPDSNMLLHL